MNILNSSSLVPGSDIWLDKDVKSTSSLMNKVEKMEDAATEVQKATERLAETNKESEGGRK